MLRLTLLVSGISSATFAATFAFAPAVMDAGQRLFSAQTQIAREAPAVLPQEIRECGPLAKIVAALERRECH